ncbi:aminopeptidase N [Asticcacaulis machinosus]|uniref:Aminopeptidase N n=1 Tax=Asticcacaulis machinosus TaxID=2984211 RepID=A0ABT5HJ57_9CAUL|nr:aminopeptidase N [Asticcacaulis machinosus]MDC7676196.1 aminopeptidase N [Asticcacaulis machinosus]
MRTEIARPIRLTDYRAPAYRVSATDLTFRLDPTETRVTTRLSFERLGESPAPLVLLGERVKLISIKLDGADLSPDTYEITPETLTLRDVPAQFVLETEVEINPQDNKTLEGLYMSSGRYCTQCEAEGFRKITYFPDRPDVLSKYTVRVEAPKIGFPHLLSNGNLIEYGDLDDTHHYAVWQDPFNKPSYLFALVAGELDVLEDTFTTSSGRTVDLKIYVDTGMSARAAYAMDALKRSMAWDESAYGREYDLDLFMIVAVRDFNFGAMENKGLNIFNASLLLADPTTATDADYERIESVIAHEYFHNWSGNRVTCRDWFQLCLKEGLTVFRDQGFSSDQRGHAVQRIKDVKALRARQFPEDAGPLAHPVRPSSYLKIDNFYTATIYEKGAEIVGMLKTVMGPKVYRTALDHYFATHDGTAATLEDFLKSFEAVTGNDVSNWLNWYTQAGTPRLKITQTYDAAAKSLTLSLSQSTAPTPSQPTKAAVPIPVRLGILSEDGTPQSFGFEGQSQIEITYVLDQPFAAITLTDVAAAPVLSALRHFSAPVILEVEEPQSHLFARFKGDTDPFNRWEAAQKLAQNLILTGGDVAPYAEALKATLLDDALEPAFKALIMALPTEQGLAQEMSPVDPAAIHTRRKAVKAELSRALYPTLRDLYDAIQPPTTFSPDAQSAGGRALRNALLDLIMAGYGTADAAHQSELSALASAHYARADNMTDMIAALTALMSVHGEPYEAALDAFYARFKDEPLVIDKWFALQAACPHPETLARIERLSRHPDFDPKVPNRWRALVQNLASNNPAVFHGVFASDSYGYGFVVDQILTVDEFNPMTAARLVESLSGYKRYASPYREAMKAALESIMATPKLSKNVAELTAKALDQK